MAKLYPPVPTENEENEEPVEMSWAPTGTNEDLAASEDLIFIEYSDAALQVLASVSGLYQGTESFPWPYFNLIGVLAKGGAQSMIRNDPHVVAVSNYPKPLLYAFGSEEEIKTKIKDLELNAEIVQCINSSVCSIHWIDRIPIHLKYDKLHHLLKLQSSWLSWAPPQVLVCYGIDTKCQSLKIDLETALDYRILKIVFPPDDVQCSRAMITAIPNGTPIKHGTDGFTNGRSFSVSTNIVDEKPCHPTLLTGVPKISPENISALINSEFNGNMRGMLYLQDINAYVLEFSCMEHAYAAVCKGHLDRYPKSIVSVYKYPVFESILGSSKSMNIKEIISNAHTHLSFPRWDPTDMIELCSARDKATLVKIMAHTVFRIRENKYLNSKGTWKPLNTELLRTTVIEKNILQQAIPAKSTATSQSYASISVSELDCLIVAQDLSLKNPNSKVAVLNMANEVSPGGGYCSGAFAQEEELFRRSTYAAALDPTTITPTSVEIQSKNRIEYPWNQEVVAVVTEGVNVFRGSSQKGYPLLDEPFEVTMIATAAPNRPKLTRDGQHYERLEDAELMYSRCHGMLRAAAKMKVNHLILSALGCGAFRNPAESVAHMFQAILPDYLCCFDSIVFAIIDEKGDNIRVFRNAVTNISVRNLPTRTENCIPALCKLGRECKEDGCAFLNVPPCSCDGASDSNMHMICYKHECSKGGSCSKLDDAAHNKICGHPPFCPYGGDCYNTKSDHLKNYRHVPYCDDKSFCYNTSLEHEKKYRHPKNCDEGAKCVNNEKSHLKKFRHFPQCSQGKTCKDKSFSHLAKFRHCVMTCARGNNCEFVLFPEHTEAFSHGELSCSFGSLDPFSQAPQSGLMGICSWGDQCNKKGEILHTSQFLHLPRSLCRDGAACKQYSEQHFGKYSHPGVKNFRPPCHSLEACKEMQNVDHIKKFSHTNNRNAALGAAECVFALNFAKNASHLERALKTIVVPEKSIRACKEFLQRALPVHRLKPATLLSVLSHGYFMSVRQMKRLASATAVQEAAQTMPYITMITDSAIKKLAADFAKEYVGVHYRKDDVYADPARIGAFVRPVMVSPSEADHISTKNLEKAREALDASKRGLVKQIESEADNLMKVSKQLLRDVAVNVGSIGIGYEVDKELGTDDTVFTIVGPHSFDYGPISIIFKKEVMFHPSFYCHMSAATFYYTQEALFGRPHVKLAGAPKTAERKKQYLSAGQNFAIPEVMDLLAKDLAIVVNHLRKKDKKGIVESCKEVIELFADLNVNNHCLLEGHLPSRVPLTAVKEILIPEGCLTEEQSSRLEEFRKQMKNHIKIRFIKNISEAYKAAIDTAPVKELKLAHGFSFSVKREDRVVLSAVAGSTSVRLDMGKGTFLLGITCSDANSFCVYFCDNYVYIVSSRSSPFAVIVLSEADIKNTALGYKLMRFEVGVALTGGKMKVTVQRISGPAPLPLLEVTQPITKNAALSLVSALALTCSDRPVHISNFRWKKSLTEPRTPDFSPATSSPSIIQAKSEKCTEREPAQSAEPSVVTKVLSYFWPGNSMCAHPSDCIIMGYNLDRMNKNMRDHIEKCTHNCRYGGACTIQEEAHKKLFTHEKKEVCAYNPCKKLGDKAHRLGHSHKNLLDIPYKCKDGPNCKLQNNAKHLEKYSHWNLFEYGAPTTNDNEVEEKKREKPEELDTKVATNLGSGRLNERASFPHKDKNSYNGKGKKGNEKIPLKPAETQLFAGVKDEAQKDAPSNVIGFVMDITSSMSGEIRACTEQIVNQAKIIEEKSTIIARNAGYYGTQKVEASFSLVGYRDIGDSSRVQSCEFGTAAALKSFSQSLTASGGGDMPEDMCSGLDASLKLKWPQGIRQLIIIADAPNHGQETNDSRYGDNHFDCDEKGQGWYIRWTNIFKNINKLGIHKIILIPVRNPSILDKTEDYFKKKLGNHRVTKISVLSTADLMDTITKSAADSYEDAMKKKMDE